MAIETKSILTAPDSENTLAALAGAYSVILQGIKSAQTILDAPKPCLNLKEPPKVQCKYSADFLACAAELLKLVRLHNAAIEKVLSARNYSFEKNLYPQEAEQISRSLTSHAAGIVAAKISAEALSKLKNLAQKLSASFKEALLRERGLSDEFAVGYELQRLQERKQELEAKKSVLFRERRIAALNLNIQKLESLPGGRHFKNPFDAIDEGIDYSIENQVRLSEDRFKSMLLDCPQRVAQVVIERALASIRSGVKDALRTQAGEYLFQQYANKILLPGFEHDVATSFEYRESLYGPRDPAKPIREQTHVKAALDALRIAIVDGVDPNDDSAAAALLRTQIIALPYALECCVREAIRALPIICHYLEYLKASEFTLQCQSECEEEGILPIPSPDILTNYSRERWEVARDTAQKFLGVKEATSKRALDQISQAAASELFASHEHEDRTVHLGGTLYSIPRIETLPFAVLNAYRESGISGERPFLSFHAKGGADTILGQYILGLTPTVIEAAAALRVPGLIEILELIRADPDNFTQRFLHPWRSGQEAPPPNPVWQEINQNLIRMCLHYLKSGDPKLQFYVLGALPFLEIRPSKETVGELAKVLRTTPDKKVRQEIFDVVTESNKVGAPAAAIILEELANPDSALQAEMPLAQRKEIAARMFGAFVDGALPVEVAKSLATVFETKTEAISEMHAQLKLLADPDISLPMIPYRPHQSFSILSQFESLLRALSSKESKSQLIRLLENGYRYREEDHAALPLMLANVEKVCTEYGLLRELGLKTREAPLRVERQPESFYLLSPIACMARGTHTGAREILSKSYEKWGEVPLNISHGLMCGLRPALGRASEQEILQNAVQLKMYLSEVHKFADTLTIEYDLLETTAFLFEAGLPASDLNKTSSSLLELSRRLGPLVRDTIFAIVHIWPDQGKCADGLNSVIQNLLPYCGRVFSDAQDLSQLKELFKIYQRLSGKAHNEATEIKTVFEFAEEFGTLPLCNTFSAWLTLRQEEPLTAELIACGVTRTGAPGVQQLRAYISTLVGNLTARDGSISVRSELDIELLSSITGFDTAPWRHTSLLQDIVERFNRAQASAELLPTPHFIQAGSFHVKQLDAEQLALFSFSKPCQRQFVAFQEDLSEALLTSNSAVEKQTYIVRNELSQVHAALKRPLSSDDAAKDLYGKRAKGREQRANQIMQLLSDLDSEEKVQNATNFIRLLSEFKLNDCPATGAVLRRLVIRYAINLAQHSTDLHRLSTCPLSGVTLGQMIEFIDEVVLEQGLAALAISPKSRAWKHLREILSPQSLKEDLERLQRIHTRGIEEWQALPTRGLLAELSASIADTCWSKVQDLVKSHANFTAVIFAKGKGANLKLEGACLLIDGRSAEGERVLIIRGLNPKQNQITRLQAQSFIEEFLNWLEPQAKKGGYGKILIPGGASGGSQTNRPPINDDLRKRYNKAPTILLESDPPTTFNGYHIESSCFMLRNLSGMLGKPILRTFGPQTVAS